MHHRVNRSIERRDFLRWGALLGAVGVLGCSAEGEGTVAPPQNAPSGKNRMKMIETKVDESKDKQKKK